MPARVVKDTQGKGLKALERRLRRGKHEVGVGVPAGPVERDGTPLALVAAVNEFGSRDGHIPERSFLRGGIRHNRPALESLQKRLIQKVARGSIPDGVALAALGADAAGKVQQYMVSGHFTPNAPSTIAAKGSDKPLLNTGTLRQNITFKVGGL